MEAEVGIKEMKCLHCERTDIFGRGMCQLHYRRWLRHGDPLKLIKRFKHDPCHCGAEFYALGLCKYHYNELRYKTLKEKGLCITCCRKNDRDKMRCSRCASIRKVKKEDKKCITQSL